MPSIARKALIYALGLAFLAVITAVTLPDILHSRASLHWPTASGRVVSSSLESIRDRRRTTYLPKVEYTYRVQGEEYSGDKVGFGDGFGESRAAAEERLAHYPPGAQVQVFYDPNRPDDSCLEPGRINTTNYLFLAFGVFLLGMAHLKAQQPSQNMEDEPIDLGLSGPPPPTSNSSSDPR